MQVERDGERVRMVLDKDDVRMLRRALERASYIDTPISEQADIAAFCARALEALSPRP